MNKFIAICETVNAVLKKIWPYIASFASGGIAGLLSGCSIYGTGAGVTF